MAVYLLLEERIGALNPKQTELLIAAREDAERLLDLINNLLDLAPPGKRRVGERTPRAKTEELLRRAADELRALVSTAGANLTVRTEAGLPAIAVSADSSGTCFPT